MPKIFVPHLVTKYNVAKGCIAPALDFSDALRFGELQLVLDNDYKSEFFADAVNKIKASLSNVTVDDYFIATGDPAIISICASVIAKKTGRLNILRWDRQARKYFATTTEV